MKPIKLILHEIDSNEINNKKVPLQAHSCFNYIDIYKNPVYDRDAFKAYIEYEASKNIYSN